MTPRPQYKRMIDRLRRMAASEFFISNASDKAEIARAADVLERLVADREESQ